MRKKITALLSATLLALTPPLLTACSNETTTPTPSLVTIAFGEGWAKAGKIDGMTGVFGTLTNYTDEDYFIVGVESDAAEMVELHEVTADGIMREIEGDVVIPAGESYELSPGANHIMLMGLTRELLAGDEVAFTLHLRSSGGTESSMELTVPVKDYAGANEDYDDLAHGDHGGHDDDHGGHDDDHGDGHGDHDGH